MEPHFANNDRNPRGRPRGHGVSWFLNLVGNELLNGTSKKEIIARRLMEILLDKKTPQKDFLQALQFMAERTEGKPIGMELTGSMDRNPFAEVDTTAIVERLRQIQESKNNENK